MHPNAIALDPSVDINDGNWHDVTLARIGTTLVAEIDGVQSFVTLPTIDSLNLSPLRLGRWQGNNLTDNNFKGYIDNLSISILGNSPDPEQELEYEMLPSDNEFVIQVGSNLGQNITIKFDELSIPDGSILTKEAASISMVNIDAKLEKFNKGMASIGAVINRMSSIGDNLLNISQNTSASRSGILDADYAKASSDLAKTQIISQAATAMLAQANQNSQSVLQLLQK
jgi:flagellin-like hook-associated protein FlgL